MTPLPTQFFQKAVRHRNYYLTRRACLVALLWQNTHCTTYDVYFLIHKKMASWSIPCFDFTRDLGHRKILKDIMNPGRTLNTNDTFANLQKKSQTLSTRNQVGSQVCHAEHDIPGTG
jgi:hypothetical protein